MTSWLRGLTFCLGVTQDWVQTGSRASRCSRCCFSLTRKLCAPICSWHECITLMVFKRINPFWSEFSCASNTEGIVNAHFLPTNCLSCVFSGPGCLVPREQSWVCASLPKSTLSGLALDSLKPAVGGTFVPRKSADIRSQSPYPPIVYRHITRKGFHLLFPSCQTQSALGCPSSMTIFVFSFLLSVEASHQFTKFISSCSLAHG